MTDSRAGDQRSADGSFPSASFPSAPSAGRQAADPPAPKVSSSVYDADYYTHWCAGYEGWVESGGARPDALYEGMIARARLAPGDVLVDLGSGRGELIVVAAKHGAARAIGIEYSHDALEFSKKTLEGSGVKGMAAAMAADSRRVPLPGGIADLVTMLDIVEHLSPDELLETLVEARRLLRPGGRLFAHTLPTRTIYDVTYRLQRMLVPGRRKRWPADPRVDLERVMHINEQTLGSLRRSLHRAGFSEVKVTRGEWVHSDFVPDERARRLYGRLAAHKATAAFGVADLWAEAIR